MITHKPIHAVLDNQYVAGYLQNTHYEDSETDDSHTYYMREDIKYFDEMIEGIRKDVPNPVYIPVSPVNDAIGYSISITENTENGRTVTFPATVGNNECSFLKINTDYTIYVTAVFPNSNSVTDIFPLKTSGIRRLIKISDRVLNCRDLGGQKTLAGKTIRQGLIYRCGMLNKCNKVDVDFIESMLGIQLVIGLAHNTVDADLFHVECYHPYNLQQWDYIDDTATRQQYITVLRKLITALQEGKPVLVHCNGGADRTGLFCAIIEGICGVSEEDICKDYELTSFSRYVDGTLLSRTRKGVRNPDYPNEYRDIGFGSGMRYIKSLPGNTLQEKWQAYLIDSSLKNPLTKAEIQQLVTLILV